MIVSNFILFHLPSWPNALNTTSLHSWSTVPGPKFNICHPPTDLNVARGNKFVVHSPEESYLKPYAATQRENIQYLSWESQLSQRLVLALCSA